MSGTHVLIQLIIAIACAGIANILVPRQIPGKFAGLILIGLTGVWLGEWGHALLRQAYGLDYHVLQWQIEGVTVIPAILGSTIILYMVTAVLKWMRYGT
jgi:uncharacterized membrane protein YeaQ/YmgE (transglycosylase-associated protein family)